MYVNDDATQYRKNNDGIEGNLSYVLIRRLNMHLSIAILTIVASL